MNLQCPNCNSSDLQKVSLAYQKGIARVNTRTRLRGVMVGSDGPDLIVGRATTQGIQQTALSKIIAPPVKWSYAKLIGWSILVFLAAGWLVFYVNTVTTKSQTVSSLALTVYVILALCVFMGTFAGYWRHNRSTYPRQFANWERSYLCERCGKISEQLPLARTEK